MRYSTKFTALLFFTSICWWTSFFFCIKPLQNATVQQKLWMETVNKKGDGCNVSFQTSSSCDYCSRTQMHEVTKWVALTVLGSGQKIHQSLPAKICCQQKGHFIHFPRGITSFIQSHQRVWHSEWGSIALTVLPCNQNYYGTLLCTFKYVFKRICCKFTLWLQNIFPLKKLVYLLAAFKTLQMHPLFEGHLVNPSFGHFLTSLTQNNTTCYYNCNMLLSNSLALSMHHWFDETQVVLTHHTVWTEGTSVVSVLPAPRQLSLLPPPADSGSRVSMHLAVEVHRVVCQHHLVHRLFGEHWPLWN